MAAIRPIQISQGDITNLTQQTQIDVTTNTPGLGYNRKLQKIKEIIRKSAESQLLVAAYYNKLIVDTRTNPALYADGVNYRDYTVSVNNVVLTPQTDIDNGAFDTVPLVRDYKAQVQRIDTEITNAAAAAATGGIVDDGNTYDGGRTPFILKSKKKKKKTSIKRR